MLTSSDKPSRKKERETERRAHTMLWDWAQHNFRSFWLEHREDGRKWPDIGIVRLLKLICIYLSILFSSLLFFSAALTLTPAAGQIRWL